MTQSDGVERPEIWPVLEWRGICPRCGWELQTEDRDELLRRFKNCRANPHDDGSDHE